MISVKYFNLVNILTFDKTPASIKSKIPEIQIMNTDNEYTGKKRRREQYEKESLISEWVEVDQQLYNEEQFEYFEQEQNVKCSNTKFCLYCNFFKIFDTNK
jgi:hypothetical protein